MSATEARVSAAPGWQAGIRLGFARAGERTVLSERRHQGPLMVQRPFYPEGPGVCHVCLLHPPGGLVGGDQLTTQVTVGARAHALITTPAAGKCYRSGGESVVQAQSFHIESGASLEWLPQETIVYGAAKWVAPTEVVLADDGRFAGWEILCLGRPAAGDDFATGHCSLSMKLLRNGKPLFLERAAYDGGYPIMREPWGLAGHSVVASFVLTGNYPGLDQQLTDALPEPDGSALWAVTQLPEVLVVRYRGNSAAQARELLKMAWSVLRPVAVGRAACAPRIWNS